jgi:hypothetical protein
MSSETSILLVEILGYGNWNGHTISERNEVEARLKELPRVGLVRVFTTISVNSVEAKIAKVTATPRDDLEPIMEVLRSCGLEVVLVAQARDYRPAPEPKIDAVTQGPVHAAIT